MSKFEILWDLRECGWSPEKIATEYGITADEVRAIDAADRAERETESVTAGRASVRRFVEGFGVPGMTKGGRDE